MTHFEMGNSIRNLACDLREIFEKRDSNLKMGLRERNGSGIFFRCLPNSVDFYGNCIGFEV